MQGALGSFLIVGIGERARIGNARSDSSDHAGIGAPGDLRRDVWGVEFDGEIELGIFIGMQETPIFDGGFELLAAGNERAALHVGEGGVIGGDHAGARATFDGHIANGHAAVHGKGMDGFAVVFNDVAGAAADADFADDGEDEVFGGDAARAFAVDKNVHGFGFALHQALRGHNVLDFAGADAEGERAECAVRGSMTVAADEGLAGLGEAELGADDVNDALVAAIHVDEWDAEFAAVAREGFELEARVGVEDWESAIGGEDGVVHHGESEIGAAKLAAFGLESGEALRGSGFVDEVAVDIDDGRLAWLLVDEMGVPNFLVEGFRRGRFRGVHGVHRK